MTQLSREQATAKVRKLVKLAAHSKTPPNEASTAAIRACKLIKRYDLLDSPLDALAASPVAQAAKTIYDTVNNPSVKAAGSVISDLFKKVQAERRR